MIYFKDLQTDKSKSIGITNLLSNITTKDHSHKGGWTKLLRCQLINAGYNNVTIISNKERLADFDSIIFDAGAEFAGTINLFGGLNDKAYSRVEELKEFKGKLYSWQHELPCLDKLIESRQHNNSTFEGFKGYPKLNLFIEVFEHVEHKKHLLFGDSHTPSVWTPDMMIERRDGRTLFGAVKNEEIDEAIAKYNPDELTLYLGNIDIRHHICRVNDSDFSSGFASFRIVRDLVNSLPLGLKVNLVQPLYIEDESRKLPKTGYYKGKPFYGTWFDRNHARYTMATVMENLSEEDDTLKVIGWPEEFVNELGQLTFEVMERPQSIHLSPKYYKWDLDNNEVRIGT